MTMLACDALSDEAIYLYGLADASRLDRGEVVVEDGTAFLVHPVGNIVALVQIVPLAEFDGDGADEHLCDLGWLAPRVLRHQAVIRQAMRSSPVLPLGFGTLFRSLARLEPFIGANRPAITDFLDAVTGKEEWAVKAYVQTDFPPAMEALAAERHPELADAAPGTRYLHLRRLHSMLAAEHRRTVAAEAERLLAEVAATVHALRDLPVRSGCEPPGRSTLRNCAILVDTCRTLALRGEIERLAAAGAALGLYFTLSGPWPPFSFVPPLMAAKP